MYVQTIEFVLVNKRARKTTNSYTKTRKLAAAQPQINPKPITLAFWTKTATVTN